MKERETEKPKHSFDVILWSNSLSISSSDDPETATICVGTRLHHVWDFVLETIFNEGLTITSATCLPFNSGVRRFKISQVQKWHAF